jgi:hypothetical protein
MLTTRLVSNMERVWPGLLHHSLLTAKGGPDILKPLAVCDISWFVVQPALLPIIFFGGCRPMVPDEPSQVAFSFVFDPESQHAEKKRYSIVHECGFSCAMA